AELAYQAAHAPSVPDRLWALDQLGGASAKDKVLARAAVRASILHDPFYGVRVNALDAAAALDDARTIGLALRDADPRVRIAAGQAVGALAHADDTALIAALREAAASTDAWTAGAAYQGLGAAKAPGSYDALVAALRRPSYAAVIARGAITGLGALGDRRAIPLLEAWARYGAPEAARPAAIGALAKLGRKHSHALMPLLESIALHDPYFRARGAAVGGLGTLGSPHAIAVLRQVERNDLEGGVKNAASDAIVIAEAAAASAKHRSPKTPVKKRG
ncbi:MAG: HEAT repeat domain-containing protein, partial [Candidatus Eremiobacteraeota bacterium]|nr:HEAT repeat domain-containing protein [Candidatus Eremiobacteraeota bacterium]